MSDAENFPHGGWLSLYDSLSHWFGGNEDNFLWKDAIDRICLIADEATNIDKSIEFPLIWLPNSENGCVSKINHVEIDQYGASWLMNDEDETNAANIISSILPAEKAPISFYPSQDAESESLSNCLNSIKKQFEFIPSRAFTFVRSACNPAEGIGRGLFINRSAMKLANLDILLNVVVNREVERTNVSDPVSCSICKMHTSDVSSSMLHWLDICAGPGGFSEYICWALQWDTVEHAYDIIETRNPSVIGMQSIISENTSENMTLLAGCGWGMTLSSSVDQSVAEENSDWQLEHFEQLNCTVCCGGDKDLCTPLSQGFAVVRSSSSIPTAKLEHSLTHFRTTYACDSTGDITNEHNLTFLVDLLYKEGGGRFVDLTIADGGFSKARNDPNQENTLCLLVLYECRAGLMSLKKGGNFICKLFGCESVLMRSLILVMHIVFRKVGIVKPITSRPASAECYLVCQKLILGKDILKSLLQRMEAVCDQLRNPEIYFGAELKISILEISLVDHEKLYRDKNGVNVNQYINLTMDALKRLQLSACSAIMTELEKGNLYYPEGKLQWKCRRSREERIRNACEISWGMT